VWRGAAGVDGVSLAAFELNLKGDPYKIWNRMSSGAYFPPPVRLVEIPKDMAGDGADGTASSQRLSALLP
jgi:RNA-directed DNA polymerase